MYTKLLSSLIILTISIGCTSKDLFQPNPPTFQGWIMHGVGEAEIKSEMLKCGYTNLYAREKNIEYNQEIKHENCMLLKGFKYTSGYQGTCSLNGWEKYPACVEYQKSITRPSN